MSHPEIIERRRVEILEPSVGSYTTLTPGARTYFNDAVTEYADKLLNEAINIEGIEHTGAGSPEVTAAHIEEAKWVLIRRLRMRASSSKWIVALRVGQLLMSAMVGIGASNFLQMWGSLLCVGGILLGSIFLVIERELLRDV